MILITYKCTGIKKNGRILKKRNEAEITGEITLLTGHVFWDYLYVMNFFRLMIHWWESGTERASFQTT